MKQIYEPTNIIKNILPKQILSKDMKYRKFFYVIECSIDDGILLFNTITYELLFLTNDEFSLFKNPDFDNVLIKQLIESYFLVPEDFDDKNFAVNLSNTHILIQNTYKKVPYSFFVILPTTGCNARCFYCFEAGAKVSNMTEQTAHDVADFIEKKGEKTVRIQWFGGEPLINQEAIDIICKDLKEKSIEFDSTMVSNGYLLNDENIDKAVNLWNLKTIQITLDGTEEIYNKTKDYVYKNVSSPFIRVLNNIETSLKANIQVNIRLNLGEHNGDDLIKLSKQLVERFEKYDNCHIYIAQLFEDGCSKVAYKEPADRHRLIKLSLELEKYISEHMSQPPLKDIPKSFENFNLCMAASDKSVMVLPDGHLGKCEHFVDSGFFGSIYSDQIDLKTIQSYKERKSITNHCDACEYFGLCFHLKCCTGSRTHCDDFDKMQFLSRLHIRLRNTYRKFIEQNEAKGDGKK